MELLYYNGVYMGVVLSSVFLVVKPSRIIFLVENTIPPKEERILLYIGYHNIPK